MNYWVISTLGFLACLIVFAIRWYFLERRAHLLQRTLEVARFGQLAERHQRDVDRTLHLREVSGLKVLHETHLTALQTKHEGELSAEKFNSARALTKFNEQKHKEIKERNERIENIVKHLTTIDITRPFSSGKYRICVDFDPTILHGRFDREDLYLLARHIGENVAHDIASYKFIEREAGNELYPVPRKRVPKPPANTRRPDASS